jgi:hypothetical protein
MFYLRCLLTFRQVGGSLAQRFAFEFKAVRVVEQTIQQRVGDRRIINVFVPTTDGQLTGQKRRT